ncbi:NUDIX hydrolase [uncultured Microbacterium sp.]|uniref:NUDIX hydrolase n=1 Tax=uncultured Microbacterium sp. TaxID=191216 RepID=UPI002605D863|nr:NUDIX hydrolase [uncultured Microbacterium sp.]
MTDVDFRVVYDSDGALPVRLEAARVEGAAGVYTHHRLVTADGRTGAVVIAVRDGAVMLVQSNRIAAGEELWELPRGAGDAFDEATTVTALRELMEETGFPATAARVIGRYVTDSTVYPQKVAVVSCRIEAGAIPGETDGEIADARWIRTDEITGMISNGVIADAHSLAALALWMAEGELS